MTSVTVDLPKTTVWKLHVTADGTDATNGGSSTRSRVAPVVIGFEVTSEMVASILRHFGDLAFESSSCGILSDEK